jgi:P4 family phage/plasmid primase-like protien
MLDLDQARSFLSALASHDDGTTFSFQTLYDVKPEHDSATQAEQSRRLTRTFHGDFDSVAQQLAELNQQGAGVFVCVNRTNGHGIRGKDVDRIRSFFVDDDTDHLQPDAMPLEPSIVVRSKRGHHFYWLTSNGVHKNNFGPTQRALAEKYQTDPSIKNLNRVMRIPGFLHNKGEPYLVEMECVKVERAYELDDVLQAFQIDIDRYVVKPRVQVDPEGIKAISIERRVQRARGQLRAMGPAIRNSGTGHDHTIAACRVANDFAVSDHDFLPILLDWGSRCQPPWEPDKLELFYRQTLPSIDTQRFEWGGKLLDSTYLSEPKKKRKSERPQGTTPATVYRDEDVPWISNFLSDSRPTRLEIVPDVVEISEPPPPFLDVPPHALQSTSLKQIVSGPIIKAEPIKPLDAETRAKAKRERQAKSNRIGVDIEGADDDLAHDDSSRNPRDISYYLEEEYNIRRDDSRCVYIYRENFWQETSKEFIHKLAMQYTSFAGVAMKDIEEATKLTLTRRHIPSIQWNRLGKTEVALKNGVLDFVTGELREHEPEDYLDRIIPVDYTPGAQCPLWEQLLEEWLPGMAEEKRALQQFFGYILMAHAEYKKACILFGPPDTGKSQVCMVASELAGGLRFVCSIVPDDMDDPRKLAPIKGKSLNCVPDLKKSTVLADGGFKQLVSTGDAVQVDQKFTRAEIYAPTAKHLFATNNLPTITDVTDAVFRRIMILRFREIVPLHRQDPTISTRLKDELAGILNWAITGAQELYSNHGRWPDIQSSQELIREYRLEQNPLYFFIKESGLVEESDKGHVECEKLRNAMNEFNGGKGAYGRRGFTKLIEGLVNEMPNLKKGKSMGISVVKGLNWTDKQGRLKLA